MEALKLMHCEGLEVLCLGASSKDTEEMTTEVAHLGLGERLRCLSFVPYEQMFDYLLCADIGLILYQPYIRNHIYSFPIKLCDYMLAGLPIVAPRFATEIERLVQAEKCGLLVDPTRPVEIAEALDWLCQNPDKAREMGLRGRQAIIREYNWETEARKLIKLYSDFETELAADSK
jgi:glycosyltransferase involved in cell wall biosynthesis